MENYVTDQKVSEAIKSVDFFNNGKTTVAIVELKNGFNIVGQASCVDKSNFNEDLGKKYAMEDAVKKVYELEAYLLQEKLYKLQSTKLK